MTDDDDMERGQLIDAKKLKRKHLLVNPHMLKMILSAGPWIVKILHLLIELVKIFKT